MRRFYPALIFLVCLIIEPGVGLAQVCEPDITDGPVIKDELEGALTHVFLYASLGEQISIEQIKESAPDAAVTLKESNEAGWTQIEIKLERATLLLNCETAWSDEMAEHLDGFTGYMFTVLAEKQMDSHVYQLMRQVKRTNYLYSFQGDPALPAESVELVQKVAGHTHSIVFDGTTVLDTDLIELLGAKKARVKTAKIPGFESSAKRKERSESVLKKLDLQPASTLPTVTADEEVKLRDAKEVARRAICLMAVAGHAEAADTFDAVEFLKKRNVMDSLSPKEQEFLRRDDLTEQEKSSMTWRYEALWALLWALGKVDELEFPEKQSDASKAIKIVIESGDEFVEKAELRDASEILDQADLNYRCYWLVRDAMLKEKPLEKISASINYERLYALNWLIRYMRKSWDDTVVDS